MSCTPPEPELKIDIVEYERNLREILFELQRKRILLDKCRQELNESILKQQDLERQLVNEKYKNTNDEYQNTVLRNAAEALEEERQKCSKEIVKLKVQLELAVAERHSLREQVRSQCLEINNLKRQVDDFSTKHRCHVGFQNDISEQHQKMKASLNQLYDLMNSLRKEQEELKNISCTSNISEQLMLSTKQFEIQKNIAERERDDIERKLIIKSAELSKLQQLLKNSPLNSKTFEKNTILDYWKESCKYLESQLNIEKDGTEKLTNALKLSHENGENLRKKLLQDEAKILELEKNIEKLHLHTINTETQTENTEQIIEIIDLDLVKSEPIDI